MKALVGAFNQEKALSRGLLCDCENQWSIQWIVGSSSSDLCNQILPRPCADADGNAKTWHQRK